MSDATVAQPTRKLRDLKVNERNLREKMRDIDSMAQSIEANGILQPLRIHEDGTIIAGHRRYAAAKQLWGDDAEVPVIVESGGSEVDPLQMLVENLHRQELTPMEEARGYQMLLDLEFTQKAIAEQVGVSAAHVSKRLTLLKLPSAAVKALDKGDVSVEQAYELVKLVGAPKEMWDEALADPEDMGRVITRWQRAEELAEMEEAVRAVPNATPVRKYSDVPKKRGYVAITDDDAPPMTVDEVKDMAESRTEEDEELFILISIGAGNQAEARIIEYVPKDEAPEKPKEPGTEADPETQARREEHEHRKEQFRELVSDIRKRTEVRDMLVNWFIDPENHSNGVVQQVARSLGVAPIKETDPANPDRVITDYVTALRSHAATSAVKGTQVLFAFLLHEAASQPYNQLSDSARELLDAVGYEPHPNESEPF